jgi:hypothetical protein
MVFMPFSPKAIYTSVALIAISFVFVLIAPGTTIGAPLREGSQLSYAESESKSRQDLTVIHSDEYSLIFELIPPQFLQEKFQTDNGQFDQIRIPGYGYLGVAGWPDLPQSSVLVALPPGAQPNLDILDARSEQIQGVRVLPAAKQTLLNGDPDSMQDLNDLDPEFETTYPEDSLAYSSDEYYPRHPVDLGDEHWLRDLRVVQVLIQPVLANTHQETLSVFTYLKVQISFSYPKGKEKIVAESRAEGPTFEAIQSDALLNYEEGRNWRIKRQMDVQAQVSPCMDDNAYRVAMVSLMARIG